MVFFGGIARGLRRQRDPDAAPSSQNDLLLPAAVLGLLGVALHALLYFPLQIASVQLVVAVLLGLCWGWHDRTRREKRRRRDAPFSGGSAAVAPGAVGALRAGGSTTAMGDVVNTASRLQTNAKPGSVLVGPATYAATRAVIAYESRGMIVAKGREEPVPAARRRRRSSAPNPGRTVPSPPMRRPPWGVAGSADNG